MKVFPHSAGHTVILERGEEVMAALTQAAREHSIEAASVQGIGALDQVVVGYLHVDRQEYQQHTLPGEYELLSFLGNISMKEGAPLVHAHVVLSGADLQCIGGHLFAGRVAVTAELQVAPLDCQLMRKYDPETGLWLISG